MSSPRKSRITVDTVAAILAVALVLAVILIGVAVITNVIEHQTPTQTLGENATQVLVALVGGLVGVMGSYIGFRAARRNGNGNSTTENTDSHP